MNGLVFRLPASLLVCACFAQVLPAQTTRYRDLLFSNATVTKNIAYGAAVNRHTKKTETLRLDLYQPSGDKIAKRPAIVIVHGGGFIGGDKAGGSFQKIGTDLARRGFVAISINYRLAPNARARGRADIVAAAHDMKASVRWLRKNAETYRIDASRIGCVGSSAGAYTCLEVAYVPGEGTSGNSGYSSKVHAVIDLWGALGDVTQLEKGEAPVMIIHGTKDRTVPYSNATALKKRADTVGVPAELFPLNAGHGPWTLYFNSYHVPQVVPFYYRWLRLAQLSGLQARPGYASPGTLKLDLFADNQSKAVLALGLGQKNTPLPPFGTLCLDPGMMILLPVVTLPSTPRIATRTFSFSVPKGISGSGYWQALVEGPGGTVLTNCVTTTFR